MALRARRLGIPLAGLLRAYEAPEWLVRAAPVAARTGGRDVPDARRGALPARPQPGKRSAPARTKDAATPIGRSQGMRCLARARAGLSTAHISSRATIGLPTGITAQ